MKQVLGEVSFVGWAESMALCHVGAPWGGGGQAWDPRLLTVLPLPLGVGADEVWERPVRMTKDGGQDWRLTSQPPSPPPCPKPVGTTLKRTNSSRVWGSRDLGNLSSDRDLGLAFWPEKCGGWR